jgi:16S rRNA (guanine(1405)-N(7))-methyltransferase
MQITDEILTTLVAEVTRSPKYASVSIDLVREIGSKELAKTKNIKDAIKATRNKIHQVGSAYQETPIPYTIWLEELTDLPQDIRAPETINFIRACLPLHASTKERLPFIETFFQETLAPVRPVESILDLACGLTPLCLPWIPTATNFRYTGVDIYENMIHFLDKFYNQFNLDHSFSVTNILQQIPREKVHLALILKTIPCLEQVDKSIGTRLLETLNAENILVSFPSRGLGGRSKGMAENYEAHFYQLITGKNWQVTKTEFTNEIAFLIRK